MPTSARRRTQPRALRPDTPGVAPAHARPAREPSDTTQVADAIYRAQWSKTGTEYHLYLGQPTIVSGVSFSVPANQGFVASAAAPAAASA